jgi:hypothetical protein
MPYDVLIRKNSTGEVRKCHFDFDWFKEDSDDSFWWTEGNFGCDCNRELAFEGSDIKDSELRCGETAFTAIHAILPDGRVIPIDVT